MKHVIVKNLGRHTMLKPSHAATFLPDQTFKLGDRVVFVQDSGTVPIAAKGTVVGIDRLEIEVVFDDRFMSGMDLSGRCSMHRGMTVGPQSILNLSNAQCNQKPVPGPQTAATAAPVRPKMTPTAIQSKKPAHQDDKPAGWDIMGVVPTPDSQKPKNGVHGNRPNKGPSGSGAGSISPARPHPEQGRVNQSLGFHPRPRPIPQIAARPTPGPNGTPGSDEISALLLGLLHNKIPAEGATMMMGNPVNGIHGVPPPSMPPVLPAAGTPAASLLQQLRQPDQGNQVNQGNQGSQGGQGGSIPQGAQRHPRPPNTNGHHPGQHGHHPRPQTHRGRGHHAWSNNRPVHESNQQGGPSQVQPQGPGGNQGGPQPRTNHHGGNEGGRGRRGRGRGRGESKSSESGSSAPASVV